MCYGHDYRVRIYGDALAGGPIKFRPRTQTNYQWLKAHVGHAGTECLVWPFGRFSNGYGQVYIQGKNCVASREMCILAHGNPPTPSHEAAHRCGNGHLGCVNPQHLRWATAAENQADKLTHQEVRGPEAVSIPSPPPKQIARTKVGPASPHYRRYAKLRSDNSSGHKGVCWDRSRGLWVAYICVDGRERKLGRFTDLHDAINARKSAEREFNFHQNHGRSA